jgi:hypothetical protein
MFFLLKVNDWNGRYFKICDELAKLNRQFREFLASFDVNSTLDKIQVRAKQEKVCLSKT